jgi:hypothetical protein
MFLRHLATAVARPVRRFGGSAVALHVRQQHTGLDLALPSAMAAALLVGSGVSQCEEQDHRFSNLRNEGGVNNHKARRGVPSPNDAVLAQEETLYQEARYQEIHSLLSRHVASHPEDAEALWRLARACRDTAQSLPQTVFKQQLILDGLKFAEQALELAPDNFATHKW